MINKDDYTEHIASLLPEHDEADVNYDVDDETQQYVQEAAEKKIAKMNAATLARMRLREKNELKKIEMRKTDPTYAMTDKQREKYELEQARIEENIAEIKVIEESPEAQNFLAGNGNSDLAPYSGATKRDVVKLLTSLNINLNLSLTQSDTYNLLSCLLTCNETQLNALYSDNKVPIAIKTVIKRLLDDCKIGNIETVEKLWDRVFGKATAKAQLELPNMQQVLPGIMPNSVVSREAYVLIRDTIIGKEQ